MPDIRLALMTGVDIPVPECQIVLHQPTIEEISLLGEEDFFSGIQILTITKDSLLKDNFVSEDISNFQIFMTMIKEKELKEQIKNVKSVLSILLPSYKIMFAPDNILLCPIEGGTNIILEKENYDYFQFAIKQIFCVDDKKQNSQAFNPANKKAQEIAQKIMAGRKKVAELKGESSASIFSQYLSSLSIGLRISIRELKKYTMYQLFDSIERYSLYTNWDIDIRARMAGAKADGQPDNWMKNIH